MNKTNYRICSACNKKMTKGYCIHEGDEYYCSKRCLHTKYTPKQYNKMYFENRDVDGYEDCSLDDINDAYWTEWF